MINDKQAVLKDTTVKLDRVRNYLQVKGFDGIVITTREHFAWLTGGGDNHVTFPTNIGFGAAVITGDGQFIVAHTMDADRLIEEQAAGQGYELVKMYWHQGDIRARAVELAGKRVASDTIFPGTEEVYMDLVDMHYPMTDLEVARPGNGTAIRLQNRVQHTISSGFPKLLRISTLV